MYFFFGITFYIHEQLIYTHACTQMKPVRWNGGASYRRNTREERNKHEQLFQ